MKKQLILTIILLSLSTYLMASIKGSGHVVSKTYNESNFKDIKVGGAMKVFIKQGDQYEVKIEAEDNLQDLIEVKQSGDELSLSMKNHISFKPTKDIIIYITAPNFHQLKASGASSFEGQGTIQAQEILFKLSGASKVDLNLMVTNIKANIDGASNLTLSGQSTSVKIDGSGSTNLKASSLQAQTADIDMSGACTANVNAEKALNVKISGVCNITYKGNPTITQNI